jgi:hypothetical protein
MNKAQSKKQQQITEKNEAIIMLRTYLKPGDLALTVLRHVSTSGMSRDISVFVNFNGETKDITWYVAKAMNEKLKEVNGHRAIRVTGCGMDMGFNLIYNLSWTLYPEGFKRELNKQYSRNNAEIDATDKDGGYALRQAWL